MSDIFVIFGLKSEKITFWSEW